MKKRIERTETVGRTSFPVGTSVASNGADGETVVYSLGTLYGEWPDGMPFEGNRYVDRYVVRAGLMPWRGASARRARSRMC